MVKLVHVSWGSQEASVVLVLGFCQQKVPEEQLPLKTAQHFPKLSHSLHIFLCHVRYDVKIQTHQSILSCSVFIQANKQEKIISKMLFVVIWKSVSVQVTLVYAVVRDLLKEKIFYSTVVAPSDKLWSLP